VRPAFWLIAKIDIGYRQIPFIFEIRCLLDWTVTDTTLTFFRWLKFEDIYASNYDVKTRTLSWVY